MRFERPHKCGFLAAGHGFGTALDEQIEQDADVFSFLFDQLGIEFADDRK